MWIQSTFSYNDARNLSIYKNIYFKSYDKIKSSRGLKAKLPATKWPHYPFLGITQYTLYNN